MAKLVAIDSMLFAWGIKQKAKPEDENLIIRTRNLFDTLDKDKYDIIIPAPVIAEGLSDVPIQEHTEILSRVWDNMQVYPFDALVAYKFSEMMYNYIQGKDFEWQREYSDNHKVRKQKMKFDFLLSAIAIANKAEAIYSEDQDVHTFARPYIEVRKLPNIIVNPVPEKPKQLGLFGEIL